MSKLKMLLQSQPLLETGIIFLCKICGAYTTLHSDQTEPSPCYQCGNITKFEKRELKEE